jgi:uncharacterized protein (DUF1800 family)/chitodextrinase
MRPAIGASSQPLGVPTAHDVPRRFALKPRTTAAEADQTSHARPPPTHPATSGVAMTPATRRDLLAAAARKRTAGPPPPSHLTATAIAAHSVTLHWRRPAATKGSLSYEVLRNGHHVGLTRGLRLTDTGVKPATAYVYTVRSVASHGKHGRAGSRLRVRTPAAATPAAPMTTTTPPVVTPPGPPAPSGSSSPALTAAMVDRLWWRAGFGATDVERSAWVGRPSADLVDFFLTQPQALAPTSTPPLTQQNQAIDPLASDAELVMEWLDTMQRAANPLTERLTFFWHRHFAVSRDSGVPAAFLLAYRNRLRRYGDLAANPQASFRDLAVEMTTQDGAMSYFLTGFSNVAGHPNENYAREFQELFALGVRDAAGNANYTQADVTQLARAFTGWRLDQAPASPTFGQVSFAPGSFDGAQKTIYGQTANWGAVTGKPAGARSAIDLVLAHPSHAPFLLGKLWSEFIVTPIPPDALADLVATYTSGGQLLLAPVVRKILSHPLIFESLDEPNMIKAPVVFAVGVLRLMGAPLRWFFQYQGLTNMQQRPYDPPNVAGWEGGLAWLNTTTAQARFDYVKACQYLKHNPNGYPGAQAVADVPGETPQQAYDRAYAAVGSPWLAAATRTQLLAFAQAQPATTVTQRAWLQYALRALILGGPDAQAM